MKKIPPGKVSNLNFDEIMTSVWLVGGGYPPSPLHYAQRIVSLAGGGVPPLPATLCSENGVAGRGGTVALASPLDLLGPSPPPPSDTGLRNCCRWQGPRDPPSPATEFSEPGVVGDQKKKYMTTKSTSPIPHSPPALGTCSTQKS